MNWNLIGPILSSSIVAAFLTKVLDIYTANLSYKRDYYKKIIDERLKVYSELFDVINQTAMDLYNPDKPNEFYNCVFESAASIKKFINELNNIQRKRLWMSKELSDLLRNFLNRLDKELSGPGVVYPPSTQSVIILGVSMHKEFTRFRQETEHRITIDISKMSHVSDYLKNQINHTKPD